MLITIVVGLVTLLILVGFLILAAAGVVIIVFSILAAIAANSGHLYTYPLSIQFVK